MYSVFGVLVLACVSSAIILRPRDAGTLKASRSQTLTTAAAKGVYVCVFLRAPLSDQKGDVGLRVCVCLCVYGLGRVCVCGFVILVYSWFLRTLRNRTGGARLLSGNACCRQLSSDRSG